MAGPELYSHAVTTSEPMDRSGPVPAAVRSAGYLSEEEDEEEGGSSVEEESDEGMSLAIHVDAV